MFEGSTASGAERAYRKAVDKLTELLVAEGALHAVRLKQKSKTKRKKKIAAAISVSYTHLDVYKRQVHNSLESTKHPP